jgi:3-oxoacyl-[acyl-carrier-protein] synthase II
MAEGAAALVLESSEHADRRNTSVYAELAGASSTADAHHITQPDPDGVGQAECIRHALIDSGIEPEEVDHINAHGTGTPQNDEAESRAILRALGEERGREIPVSSTKSMTGHLLGAAGALEGALCALTIARGVIPPTINLESPDPRCPLNHVTHPIMTTVDVVLSNSFGFGGTNAALIFRRTNPREGS